MPLALQFDWTMNIGQVVQTLSVLIAFMGLLMTYREIRRTSTVHTAQILKDVIFTFFSDPDIQKTFYRIGSGTLRFDPEKFNGSGSEDERCLDQLLYLFECVGRLHFARVDQDRRPPSAVQNRESLSGPRGAGLHPLPRRGRLPEEARPGREGVPQRARAGEGPERARDAGPRPGTIAAFGRWTRAAASVNRSAPLEEVP